MQSPRRSRTAGWSLVELTVVIALMGVIASTLAGAMHWMAAKQSAKQAAGDFQSMVRQASALARREMVPVRLVFILPDSADALERAGIEDAEKKPAAGCRLLLFKVPGRHLPIQSLQAPAGDEGPVMPVARMPRFESMTGAWTAAPNNNGWRRWPKVKVSGDLVKVYSEQGFVAGAKKFQFQPKTIWSENESAKANPYSIYPEDFALSPYRDLRTVITSKLPARESVSTAGKGRLTAEDVFGDQELPHWSARENRSNKADRVELPALDFLPDGGLACREDVEELEFRFADEGEMSRWVVKVRTADAEVWEE